MIYAKRYVLGAAAFALTLLLIISIALNPATPVTAAPGAAPTPVSVTYSPGASSILTFWSASARTSDGCSPLREIRDVELADLQWIVDVGTVNTTTLTLRFTNENSTAHLVTGIAVQSNIVADVTDLQQFPVFGRYVCLYADVTNSNPITITAIAKGK